MRTHRHIPVTGTATIRSISALLAAGSLVLLSVAGAVPSRAAGTPFDPNLFYVLIAQAEPAPACPGGMGTQLFEGVQIEDADENVTVQYNPIGPPSCLQYNAISYDDVDDYVYGIASNNHIVRIDSAAGVTDTGVRLPASDTGNPYTFGTYVSLSATTGELVVTVGNGVGTNSYYTIPLSGGSSSTPDTVGTPVQHAFTRGTGLPTGKIVLPNLADWVTIEGYVWGLDTNVDNTPPGEYLYRLDPASGQLSRTPLPAAFRGIGTGSFGGQWVYGNGNIGVSDNVSGYIYQIRLLDADGTPYTGGTAMPTVQIVSQIQGVTTTGIVMRSRGNDATSTPGLPVDLSVVKQVSVDGGITYSDADKFSPGDTVYYTLKVTNESLNNTSTGWFLDDPIPAGLTNVTVVPPIDTSHASSGASCTATATAVTCTGSTGLEPTEYITITLKGTVADDAPIAPIRNIATVTGNERDPDPDNNTDEADLSPLSLNFVKSASPTTVSSAPKDVTYSYAITNDGADAVYGVHIASDVATTTKADATTSASNIDLTNLTCKVTAVGAGSAWTLNAPAPGVLTPTGVTMGPDDQITCTYVRTITQGDLNAGVAKIDNTATVKWFTDEELTDAGDDLTSSATVTTVLTSDLDVFKAVADGDHADLTTLTTPAEEGQLIGYWFQVKNPGNVTQAGITVADVIDGHTAATTPQADDFTCAYDSTNPSHHGDVANGAITLDPTESATCYAQAPVTMDDLENGEVTDHATASNDDVAVESDDVVVPLDTVPSLSFNKTIDPDDVQPATVGETLTFEFTLQDNGDIPLVDIVIDDSMMDLHDFVCHYAASNPDHNDTTIDLSPTDGSISLDPETAEDPDGEAAICTATHVVTVADQQAGSVINVAFARGFTFMDFEDGDFTDPVTTPQRTVVVPIVQGKSIPGVTKTTPSVWANTGGSAIPAQAGVEGALAALSLLVGTALAVTALRRNYL